MKKKHKKPVGELSVFRISGNKFEQAPNKFVFPRTKHEIEKKVASTFLTLMKDHADNPYGNEIKLIENEENNLDFLVISDQESYLELTEITPPGKMKGGYKDLPFEHNIGKHFDKTLQLILKKSSKYAGLNKAVNLLMYITDDRSLPSLMTEKLLIYGLNNSDHAFNNVFAFYPLLENSGPIIRFFPYKKSNLTRKEYDRFHLSTLKNLRPQKI